MWLFLSHFLTAILHGHERLSVCVGGGESQNWPTLEITIQRGPSWPQGMRRLTNSPVLHLSPLRTPLILCGVFIEVSLFLPSQVSIVGSLRDREVACSASDRQGSNFESCVWRTVSSQSSHHPQEVLLAQFSLYVHKGGLKPDSFHFFSPLNVTRRSRLWRPRPVKVETRVSTLNSRRASRCALFIHTTGKPMKNVMFLVFFCDFSFCLACEITKKFKCL